jgi:hypothetical protein
MVVPGGLISFSADVVPSNVPLLVGLDILDQFRLQFLSVTNQLEDVDENGNTLWRAPVTRKHGHGYYCGDQTSEIMYTKQLIRLPRHLHHPSTNKLLSLLKRASPDEVDHRTKGLLEDIYKACVACQTYSTRPCVISNPHSRRCHLQPAASSRYYVT